MIKYSKEEIDQFINTLENIIDNFIIMDSRGNTFEKITEYNPNLKKIVENLKSCMLPLIGVSNRLSEEQNLTNRGYVKYFLNELKNSNRQDVFLENLNRPYREEVEKDIKSRFDSFFCISSTLRLNSRKSLNANSLYISYITNHIKN